MVEFAEILLLYLCIRRHYGKYRTYIVSQQSQFITFLIIEDYLHGILQPLPHRLDGHHTRCSCLEMHVVRSRRAAFRTVIEHHDAGMLTQQLMHNAEVAVYGLRRVCRERYREVFGKNRVRIHQQFEGRILS